VLLDSVQTCVVEKRVERLAKEKRKEMLRRRNGKEREKEEGKQKGNKMLISFSSFLLIPRH